MKTGREIEEIVRAYERKQKQVRKFKKSLDWVLLTILAVGIPCGIIALAIGFYGTIIILVRSLFQH